MELDATSVFDILKAHGVEHIYHANTVRTSSSFLQAGALLSRGSVERRGLDQTPQKTDSKDKELGIWNDIFLDTIDINESLYRNNLYGPVLFVFDIQLLKDESLPKVWITKSNPANWNQNTHFFAPHELNESYKPGRRDSHKNHIVVRGLDGGLRLTPYLKKIVVDDPRKVWPGIKTVDLFSVAVGALMNARRTGGHEPTDFLIEARVCPERYSTVADTEIVKYFGP